MKSHRYIGESNGGKYLPLVPTEESKNTLKKYKELWDKIIYLIRSIINNSNNYDKKYIRINLHLDNELPLSNTLKLYNMVINVRSAFQEGSKYYQVFLDECWYKL